MGGQIKLGGGGVAGRTRQAALAEAPERAGTQRGTPLWVRVAAGAVLLTALLALVTPAVGAAVAAV